MVKSRLLTDAVREVRHTKNRFLSLLVLSALAVAFLAGLRTTAPDMTYTADAYFDELDLMDVRVVSTLGLTDEDVSVLAGQPGVELAEGAYTVDAMLHQTDNDLILKLHSLSKAGINAPKLREGRLPEAPDECLVEPQFLTLTGLSLGDTVSFDTGTGDYEDALAYDSFTIVGTAASPLYVSVQRGSSSLGSGKVSAFVLLPEEAFDLETYTDAYLRGEGLEDLLCYEDEYEDRADALIDSLEPLGDERAALRYDDVIDEANEKLSDAEEELADAEAEAEQELGDAEAELKDARRELDDGWRDWNDGQQELADGWAEWRDGWETLRTETAGAQQKIADAEAELPDALKKLEDGEVELADARKELDDGWADYQSGKSEYENGVLEYENGYRELLDGEDTYNENADTLKESQRDFEDGLKEYQQGLQELADGGQQLMDAKKELDAALEQLFAGEQALSAGQAQLDQQQAGYQQLTAAFQGVTAAWNAGNLLRDSPETTGTQVGTALGALAMQAATDPTAADTFHTNYIAPLSSLLSALITSAESAGQDASQLSALLNALPADGTALLGSLTGQEAIMAQATALTSAYYGIAAALQTTGDAITAGQAQLDSAASQLQWGQMEYQDGLRQYNEAEAEFDEATEQAIQGGQDLSDAKVKLDEGWAQLYDGRKELDDAWAELEDARRELEDGLAELEDGHQELLDGEAEYADGRKELDDGWQEYRDGVADLEQAKKDLPEMIAEAEAELNDAEQELLDGEAELRDAYEELLDGEAEYADGLQEYEDGKAEAEEKLSDARRELNDARREVADLENCEWYLLGRNTNLGYVSFQQDAERMGNLASVFPLIFFLVAALVCLTTMTRMVEEQRVEIGGKKALGYSKWAISLKYVGYGLSASLTGGLLGLAVGCTLIPWIIFNAWKILYTVGELILVPSPLVCLFAVGAAAFCVTGAAIGATFSTLSATPAALMRPKAPPAGKRVLLERITPLWSRLSFTYKVTLRNLFRYQRRFWMTVIGIGGCTALILAAFGLRGSIFDVLDKQYDEIFTYSVDVGLVDDVTADERTEIERELDRQSGVDAWLPVHQASLAAVSDRQSVDATLFVVSDWEEFSSFVHLRERVGEKPITPGDDGIILTEKLAKLLGVSAGDTITLDGDRRVEVTVTAITEQYLMHYMYLSDACYEALFGETPEVNYYLARYADTSQETADQVSSALISLSGVTSVSRIQDTRNTFTKSMESVDYAVVLIIVCAAALAFVVLFNLTNINITERLRELATLKVLGFYEGELSAYVFRENVFLTIFGVILGLVLGRFLHSWMVLTVEVDLVMFGRTAPPYAYVLAAALTALFSLIVNVAAHFRLKKIDMVESLKTVE